MLDDRPHTNGELDERDLKVVEAGVTYFQQVKRDLENARLEISELQTTIASKDVIIEGLKSLNNYNASIMQSVILDRDVAVGHRAKYEAMFVTIFGMMRDFKVPTELLIHQMESDHASEIAPRDRRHA
jgi:hypothetical protein